MRRRFTPRRERIDLAPYYLPGSDEDLETYYRRAKDWLHALGCTDRAVGNFNQLTEDKYSEFYLVMEDYIDGLYNPSLQQCVRVNGVFLMTNIHRLFSQYM